MYRVILIVVISLIANISIAASTANKAKTFADFSISKIEVFHSNKHSIKGVDKAQSQNVDVQVYNLDAHTNLEKELNSIISVNGKSADQIKSEKDIEKAKTQVNAEIERLKKQGAFNSLWSGIIKAKRYGLKKHPAIVLNDGEEVLYGITNLNSILKIKDEAARRAAMGEKYDELRTN